MQSSNAKNNKNNSKRKHNSLKHKKFYYNPGFFMFISGFCVSLVIGLVMLFPVFNNKHSDEIILSSDNNLNLFPLGDTVGYIFPRSSANTDCESSAYSWSNTGNIQSNGGSDPCINTFSIVSNSPGRPDVFDTR